ncbi:MAG: DHH family phosphoesterase [bacterium]
MPDGALAPLSTLTRRLFADSPQLELRRSHLERAEFIDAATLDAIAASEAWQQTAAFIRRMIAERIPVLLFGDYDVDGSTAAFLLFRWMRGCGASGNIFLPSRFRHGYGLDSGVIAQSVEQGYRALIALDCGTANLAEIAEARAAGLEVLVIDHHTPKDSLPDCTVFNPHLLETLPPLCTAGLVLLAIILLEEDPAALAGDELELAGLATLADIVPLVPENWYLVHQALRLLPGTGNLGAQELLKISQLHGIDIFTARQLAFQVIPRMNAAGRMRSAKLICDLLASPDREEARRQALQLDLLNRERKEVTDDNYRQAARQALGFDEAPALVLSDPDWHIGVLGIVAARIAEQFRRPAIVLSQSPQDSDLLTGSARSHGGLSLVDSLAGCTAELESFGGHAAAAGVKLRRDALEAFRSAWADSVARIQAESAAAEQAEVSPHEDWSLLPELRISEMSAVLEDELWLLAPFDTVLPAPRCRLSGVHVGRCSYLGRERSHLNLVLTDGQRQVRVAAFNMSHLQPRLQPGTSLQAVIELEPDNWNNQRSIMLRLIGLITENGSQVS